MQRGGRLVQAGDGAASAQLDDLVGNVPQLEALQQINVGRVPVFLKKETTCSGFPILISSGFLHYKSGKDLEDVDILLAAVT